MEGNSMMVENLQKIQSNYVSNKLKLINILENGGKGEMNKINSIRCLHY